MTFSAAKVDKVTNPTFFVFFLNILHFSYDGGNIWVSFLFYSYKLIVEKSRSFILFPVAFMGKYKEAFFVGFKYVSNILHIYDVYGVILVYTITFCDSMRAR